jgi:hypothetical protein
MSMKHARAASKEPSALSAMPSLVVRRSGARPENTGAIMPRSATEDDALRSGRPASSRGPAAVAVWSAESARNYAS